MFTSKYKPKKLSNFVGNQQSILPFIRWLLDWEETNKKQKCALISGLNGIGKSLFVELILKKHDYHIIELTVDDEKSNQQIKPLLKTKKNVNNQKNVLVVSDIDSNTDYGFMSILVECIKETSIPIVCICDNRYDQSLKPILGYCFDVKLIKPTYDEMYAFVYKIIISEKIRINKTNIDKLIEESNGDIRFLLNTLEFYSNTNITIKTNKINSNKNIQSANIFDTTAKLLSIETPLNDKYDIYWMNYEIHTLMVQENYINNTLKTSDECKKMQNLSYSADALCDVDLFNKAVNMTNWDLEPYVAINTLKATAKCNKKCQIKFTQFLGKTSEKNKNKKNIQKDKLNKLTPKSKR